VTAVIPAGQGRTLDLPGRSAVELISGAEGGYGVTVRRVTIPPEDGSAPARGPHRHDGCPEVILVVSGAGEFTTPSRTWPVGPGDLIVVSPGEPHQTRNPGPGDLVSLCFFPVPDLAAVTSEPARTPAGGPASEPAGEPDSEPASETASETDSEPAGETGGVAR
jgi:mannose-6-phosphate isomerase-like protein (cupin superfamily)